MGWGQDLIRSSLGAGGIGQDGLWKQVELTKCVYGNKLREQVGLVKIMCEWVGFGQECLWEWAGFGRKPVSAGGIGPECCKVECGSRLDWSTFL